MPRNVQTLIGSKLRPLGVLALADGSQPELKRPNPMLGLLFRYAVTDPDKTRRLTAPFAWLFHPLLALPVGATFLAACWWLLMVKGLVSATYEAFQQPDQLLFIFLVTVLSAGFHEFGHAAAARYGGATPGVMGAGVYLVWPAFYTDVTDSYRLGRGGRVRADLGGLYFNAIVAIVIVGLWWATGYDALLLVVVTQILQMARQVAPLIRNWGCWGCWGCWGAPVSAPKIVSAESAPPLRPERSRSTTARPHPPETQASPCGALAQDQSPTGHPQSARPVRMSGDATGVLGIARVHCAAFGPFSARNGAQQGDAGLVRFDGYHVLADLTGVLDLFQRIKPTLLGLLPWNWRNPESRVLKPWRLRGGHPLGPAGRAAADPLAAPGVGVPTARGNRLGQSGRPAGDTRTVSPTATCSRSQGGRWAWRPSPFPLSASSTSFSAFYRQVVGVGVAPDRGSPASASDGRGRRCRDRRRSGLGLVAGCGHLPPRAALRAGHSRRCRRLRDAGSQQDGWLSETGMAELAALWEYEEQIIEIIEEDSAVGTCAGGGGNRVQYDIRSGAHVGSRQHERTATEFWVDGLLHRRTAGPHRHAGIVSDAVLGPTRYRRTDGDAVRD